ncbi:discoidin domain-containing protein [bacterium]|nr:discoidin domain-containing protein [bacterium]
MIRRVLLMMLALALLAPAPAVQAQRPEAPERGLKFVSASGAKTQGPNAVDGDRSTVWVGLARRTDAWITFQVRGEAPLEGVRVAMAAMPANTSYRIETSEDGKRFETVLSDLRNETDDAVDRRFPSPRAASFVRLSFTNGSRQAVIPFTLFEVSPLPEPTGALANPAPSAPRILGAVLGQHGGERVLVVVGDGFAEPFEAVRVDGRALDILAVTSTQILCRYPYPRTPRLALSLSVAGKALSRTVSPVTREIRWTDKPLSR